MRDGVVLLCQLSPSTPPAPPQRRRGVDVALTAGPWTHYDTGAKAAGVVARQTMDWLDRHVAGLPSSAEGDGPVQVYVTGADQWRALPEWPPRTTPRQWWLGDGGRLCAEGPTDAADTTFTYDPADPTPGVGDRLLSFRAGVRDNRPLESRPDVITFTTDPLTADVEVMGCPVVELDHITDNPYADVFVRLCDVDSDGESKNFSDALVRLTPDRTPGPLRLELDACAHRLRAGHRLRLLVAGGAHPGFARNTGSGEPVADAVTLRSTIHTVRGGRLSLPV
jgi:putative CocE/NonD family hydrolase